MNLIYHPDAEVELIEAAKFYESRVATLGRQFLDEVDVAVRVIRQSPEQWVIIESHVRRYLLPRFPYAIYYRTAPNQIRILAFKHNSRHPDYWRYRLSETPTATYR